MPLPVRMLPTLLIALLALMPASRASDASPETWKRQGWSHTDFSRRAIEWREILDGGPPKDGIPSIDKPVFAPASAQKDLKPADPVISVEIAGEARAYPLRILIWHEIVNDVVAGRPVTVTYCPLCNSAIVFDARAGGRTLDFGTTGKLRNSDLVMYDRQTQSWWQQFTGEAIVGSMLGTSLTILPSRLESFADFKARHPEAKVLVPSDPGFRAYGGNPYGGYDTADRPFLFNGKLPKGIEPMARVVVVRGAQGPEAVTLEVLRKSGRLTLAGVELSWRPGQASALDSHELARGRDVGTVIAERASADGRREVVHADVTFAFVFHAFHPGRPIRKQ